MSVVDFHLHLFSRPFFDALAAQSPLPGAPEERLAHVAERTGIELPPAELGQHVARWLEELDAHGVEHVAAFASAPEEVPALAEAARLADGRLTPMAVVNPTAPGCADKVRGLVREKGFGGVLLFPAMHGYDIGGPEAAKLVAALDELRAVAYVHCGMLVVKLRDLLGLPRPFDLQYANPLSLIPAANRAPNVHFVIPHFGAGFLREALMAGSMCENVYVDTSSSNSWRATQSTPLSLQDVFARALDVFGPDRILFGTDSNVFPAGWRAERLEEQVGVLDALGLGDADRGLILRGNAQRLLPRAHPSPLS